jgi:hypothetical protein
MLFHDKEVFFAQHYPLEEVLTQQEQEIFAGGFAGYTQSENISLKI